jgi:hypothetical protein
MKLLNLLLLLFLTAYNVNAQLPSLPAWFTQAFKQNKLQEKYELKAYLKPALLETDFNSDGVKDVVTTIIEKKTRKKGLLLIHGRSNVVRVFGAGAKVGKAGFDDSDDLRWVDGWGIYKDKVAYETKFDNGDIVGSIKRKLTNKSISIWSQQDGAPLAGGLITLERQEIYLDSSRRVTYGKLFTSTHPNC